MKAKEFWKGTGKPKKLTKKDIPKLRKLFNACKRYPNYPEIIIVSPQPKGL